MKFEDIMKGVLFTESPDNKKEKILNDIETAIKKEGLEINISKKSREVFLSSDANSSHIVSNPNSLCIAGIGKENYEKVYQTIKTVLKDNKDFDIEKDNYFTLFLCVKCSSNMYIKESNNDKILNLSSFSKVPITKNIINKFKSELKHIREISDGYVYIDNNDIVAVIATEKKEDAVWITAVEVFNNYKKQGLSIQLLDVAIKEFHATKLSVNKKNTVAIDIYKKYGFKTYNETDAMLFMKISNSYQESTYEENIEYLEKEMLFIEKVIDSEEKSSSKNIKDAIEHKFPGKYKRIDVKNEHIACTVEHGKGSYRYKQLWYVDDGEIIGSLTMHAEQDLIANLFIRKKFRRHGYASKLIQCAVNDYGMKELRVFKDNKNAIELYKKLGYKEIKKDPKLIYDDRLYYMKINGNISNIPEPVKDIKESVHDRPYNRDEIMKKYGKDTMTRLMKDPAHQFRADHGIELIHKEPTIDELKRIMTNWDNMSDEDKKISDKKSLELFGKTNKDHYNELITAYESNKYSDYEDILNESVLISRPDLEFNLEKWGRESNILFITGQSGSGKTTLSKNIATKRKAIIITMDMIEHNDIITKNRNVTEGDQIILNCMNDLYGSPKNTKHMQENDFQKFFEKVIKYIINYAKMNKEKLFIFEGIQVARLLSLDDTGFLSDKPVIIKGTSAITSCIRRLKRDKGEEWEPKTLKDFIKLGKQYYKWNSDMKDIEHHMKSYTEDVDEYSDIDYLSYFTENTDDTYYIKDEIYPIVEKVLSTPAGDKAFRKLVENFIDRNGQKLLTVGPVYLVPFADQDKANFYGLFNTNEHSLKESIKKMTQHINAKASWKLISQNPIFCIFYCCIRYYTVKNDTKGKDIALIIYALSAYPSIFYNYFKYGANPGVMQYTIDNMTNKFTIKNAGHIFGTLRQSITNSWEFHKPYFEDMNDKEVIRFIQRIRNDQNSLLKKIANEYYENHKKGLSVNTTVDSFDDNAVVDDITNNTSVVEDVSRKIVNGMMTGGVNLKLAEIAARICQISVVDSRFYITKIIVDKNSEKLQKFIESILFIYLYDEKHTKQDINSGLFISKFAPELFKKTNSNNPNIKFIKKTLDEWGEESGVHTQFKREASRVNYKKAIYFYIILSIQSYSN